MNRTLTLLLAACGLLLSGKAVELEWDPSPDADWLDGYRIYCSTNSVETHQLTNAWMMVDCGQATTCTITNTLLTPGVLYYFVATAYAYELDSENVPYTLESLPSNEVTWTCCTGRAGRLTMKSFTAFGTNFVAQPLRAGTCRTR